MEGGTEYMIMPKKQYNQDGAKSVKEVWQSQTNFTHCLRNVALLNLPF